MKTGGDTLDWMTERLEILRSLVEKKVEYAKLLVAAAEARGGAHGMIEHLMQRFDSRVLMEVHDLLVQVTRADQVHMVLKLLENEFKRGVDRDALRDLCCADGPRPSHLTDQGTTLSEILMCACACSFDQTIYCASCCSLLIVCSTH